MAIPPPSHMSKRRGDNPTGPVKNSGLIADQFGSVAAATDAPAKRPPMVPAEPVAGVCVGVAAQPGIVASQTPGAAAGSGGESSYRKVADARAAAVAEAKAKAAADSKAAAEVKTKTTTEAKTKATADAALAEAMQLKAAADATLAQAQALTAAAMAKANE